MFDYQSSRYPELPGCYLMRNASGSILYIGKSKRLRSRLGSYFREPQPRESIRNLVAEIADIEIILVHNEHESLLLENNLIKHHKPPYNRALKRDNSGYAYLCMTDEKVPRLTEYFRSGYNAQAFKRNGKAAVRSGPLRIKAETRFGPFLSAYFRGAVQTFVNEHYRLRTCEELPKKVCLQYHMHKCSGVCEGLIAEADYLRDVGEASRLLANGGEKLLPAMYRQMEQYADRLAFERAASMLRHIRILERQEERQIVDREAAFDQDAMYCEGDRVLVANVRKGMLRQVELLRLDAADDPEAFARFLAARYADTRPAELIINRPEYRESALAALKKRGATTPKVTVPQRGAKRGLLELCRINYEYRVSQDERLPQGSTL